MGKDGTTPLEERELSVAQKENLETLRRVLRIQIDGEWDGSMIETAFDRLERLLSGGESGADSGSTQSQAREPKSSRSGGRRRRRS